MKAKTQVTLTGTDGNVFSALAKCTKALKADKKPELAKELSEKIWDCESYSAALKLMAEYVDIN